MSNQTEKELAYLILENDEGELMLSIEERAGDPVEAKIIYDGKDHALLYRKPDEVIVLDYINPLIREKFKALKTLKVAENKDKKVVMFYEVPVKIVSKLPVSDGLTTLEELLNSNQELKNILRL